MHVTLRIASGPWAGRTLFLRAGQVAQVGRTEWADFSVPDEAMAEIHFALDCRPDGCLIRDLGTGAGTNVDGDAVAEGWLRDGSEIVAGRTRFRAELPTTAAGTAAGTAPVGPTDTGGPADAPPSTGAAQDVTARDVAARFDLDAPAAALLAESPHQPPRSFLAALTQRGLWLDALRFQAHWLPKREAVAWALACMQDDGGELTAGDRMALEATARWLDDPQDTTRRDAGAAAEALQHGTPAAWVATAVFWSGGSIASPELPAVPPAEHLCGTAVSAALLMSAAGRPPTQIEAAYREFLARASVPPARRPDTR
jgi:hypothetical protein